MSTEEQRAEYRADYQYKAKKAQLLHICIECGKDLEPKPDGTYKRCCPECQKRKVEWNRAKKARRKAEHKCRTCGVLITDINPRTMDYYVDCAACRVKRRKRL